MRLRYFGGKEGMVWGVFDGRDIWINKDLNRVLRVYVFVHELGHWLFRKLFGCGLFEVVFSFLWDMLDCVVLCAYESIPGVLWQYELLGRVERTKMYERR